MLKNAPALVQWVRGLQAQRKRASEWRMPNHLLLLLNPIIICELRPVELNLHRAPPHHHNITMPSQKWKIINLSIVYYSLGPQILNGLVMDLECMRKVVKRELHGCIMQRDNMNTPNAKCQMLAEILQIIGRLSEVTVLQCRVQTNWKSATFPDPWGMESSDKPGTRHSLNSVPDCLINYLWSQKVRNP